MAKLTPEELAKLKKIVAKGKANRADKQTLDWEFAELCKSAWDACGVAAKTIKQLIKEAAWDETTRDEHALHEERLAECRAALGMLASTPLGEAAAAAETATAAPDTKADKAAWAETKTEAPKADKPAKPAKGSGRGPGRPKGSTNKPKLTVVGNAPAAEVGDPGDPPAIPDVSTAA